MRLSPLASSLGEGRDPQGPIETSVRTSVNSQGSTAALQASTRDSPWLAW